MSEQEEHPFGENEERAIVSLALDNPEFFTAFCDQIDPDYFQIAEAKYIYNIIDSLYKKHQMIPTRGLIKDIILKKLTVDDDYDDIIKLLNRKSDPREIPVIKETLLEWAKHKAIGMLYTEEAYAAFDRKDYESLETIFESARKITDVSARGTWFFRNIPTLFQEDIEEKLTCGFKPLDRMLNDGGPTRGDVCCYMGETGKGKSYALINAGVANYRMGRKVAHFTFELSDLKTRLRYMGAFTGERLIDRGSKKTEIERKLNVQQHSYGDNLVVFEFPPDEHSVSTLYQSLEILKRSDGWVPDVVIIDYLEQMVSRNKHYNNEEYARQKKVTTEIRGFAKNTKTLILTATQANRAQDTKGKDAAPTIDLNRIAESYGKAMPLDYIISINQTPEEYDNGTVRLYIAKNRNGRSKVTVHAKVDYLTATMRADS